MPIAEIQHLLSGIQRCLNLSALYLIIKPVLQP